MLAAAASMALPAAAKRPFEDCCKNIGVYDVQDVLTAEEESQLDKIIRETSDKIDMYVAVYIYGPETSFYSDYAVETTADDNYDRLFNPKDGTDTDGVLLLLNNSTMYDYLSTSGMGELYYYNGSADDRSYAILDNITPKLKIEDYYGAVETFCSELERYYEAGIPKNAYTYNSSNGMYYYERGGKLVSAKKLPFGFGKNKGIVALISAAIGAIAGAISNAGIKASNSNKLPLSPTNYVSRRDSMFAVQQDTFLRTHTDRTFINRDTGGGGGGIGGGGSSHISSGGHSHGGGGHHR